MKTNIELLRERIEQNYKDYRADTLDYLDGDLFFHMAQEVAAVEDAYALSKTRGWIEEAEAAYLLEFADPLKMLADAWEEFLFDADSEFRMVVEDVLDRNDNNVNYMTVALADELREKYGEDVYYKDALLSEAVKTGKKYLQLKGLLEDEGVDLCIERE